MARVAVFLEGNQTWIPKEKRNIVEEDKYILIPHDKVRFTNYQSDRLLRDTSPGQIFLQGMLCDRVRIQAEIWKDGVLQLQNIGTAPVMVDNPNQKTGLLKNLTGDSIAFEKGKVTIYIPGYRIISDGIHLFRLCFTVTEKSTSVTFEV